MNSPTRKKTNASYRLGMITLAIILLLSLFAPLMTPRDPNEIDPGRRLLGPSRANPLGTDTLGRDILSRVLMGGRVSIVLSIAASAATMALGLLIGVAGGYFGGAADSLLSLLTGILQGLPGMSLMIAIAGVMGPGVRSLLIAQVIVSWPDFARIVRGETMRLREEDFVEGLRSVGAGPCRILFAHIVPNIAGPIVVLFTTRIGFGILSISGLSFLGIGLQPPTPDWGVMVRDAMLYFRERPLLLIAPGLCIFLTVMGINLIGEYLRDRFDVRVPGRRDL